MSYVELLFLDSLKNGFIAVGIFLILCVFYFYFKDIKKFIIEHFLHSFSFIKKNNLSIVKSSDEKKLDKILEEHGYMKDGKAIVPLEEVLYLSRNFKNYNLLTSEKGEIIVRVEKEKESSPIIVDSSENKEDKLSANITSELEDEEETKKAIENNLPSSLLDDNEIATKNYKIHVLKDGTIRLKYKLGYCDYKNDLIVNTKMQSDIDAEKKLENSRKEEEKKKAEEILSDDIEKEEPVKEEKKSEEEIASEVVSNIAKVNETKIDASSIAKFLTSKSKKEKEEKNKTDESLKTQPEKQSEEEPEKETQELQDKKRFSTIKYPRKYPFPDIKSFFKNVAFLEERGKYISSFNEFITYLSKHNEVYSTDDKRLLVSVSSFVFAVHGILEKEAQLDFLSSVFDYEESGKLSFDDINEGLASLAIKSTMFYPKGLLEKMTVEKESRFIFKKGIKTKRGKYSAYFIVFSMASPHFEKFLSSNYMRIPKAEIVANNTTELNRDFGGKEREEIDLEEFEKCLTI